MRVIECGMVIERILYMRCVFCDLSTATEYCTDQTDTAERFVIVHNGI